MNSIGNGFVGSSELGPIYRRTGRPSGSRPRHTESCRAAVRGATTHRPDIRIRQCDAERAKCKARSA